MPIFISPEQLHSAIRDISWSLPEDAYLAKGEDRMLTTGSKLPHSKIRGKLQHVTWRTHDSIPQEQVDLLLRRADQFRLTHPLPWDKPTETEYRNMWEKKINSLIDRGYGSCQLKHLTVRQALMECFTNISETSGEILAYAIMPNHVHLLIRNFDELDDIIGEIKRVSALKINELIGENGAFWHRNYFDRMMRTEHQLETTILYIVNNPRYLKPGEYTIWVRGLGEIYFNKLFINGG